MPTPERARVIGSLTDLLAPRRGQRDPVRARERSLELRPVRGARFAQPIKSLPELRAIIEATPGSIVAISDVHGQRQVLERVVIALGLYDGRERRCRSVEVISLGDLIDGRSPDDMPTLELGMIVCDAMIAGNHEICLMGGGAFAGPPDSPPPGVRFGLRDLADKGVLVPACFRHGVFLSHGGITTKVWKKGARDGCPALLSKAWSDFLTLRKLRPELFESGVERGGNATDGGGIFWESWSHLVRDHPQGVPQIVGHTPRGRIEQ